MGTTSARKTIVGSLQYLTMISKVAVFCLLATVAHSAPSPDPQIPVGLPVAPSNCVTEYDDIEVQSCAPAPERVCETKTIIHQRIAYEQRCKDVTSKHCGGGPVVLKKREAEADPQFWGGYGGYGLPALAAPAVHAPALVTVKQACQEVTTKHCVDVPITEDVPQDIETCHIEEKVACTPVETVVPAPAPVLGGYYGHPYGLGLGLP